MTCGALCVGAKIDVAEGSPAVWAGPSVLPCGVSVRWRAARTLCSICERRAEYIERFSTDFRRRTKKTATMPSTATNGPTSKSTGIGADYRRSVHV